MQPGLLDDEEPDIGTAAVKRIAEHPVRTNTDAAIADLFVQEEGHGWTRDVARDLIRPVSAANPAVGIVTLGDIFGNIFITRMDIAISALDVTPIIGRRGDPRRDDSPAVVAPELGMDVEKVGRTTAYSSSVISAVDAEVKVGSKRYYDLAYCPWFGLAGDSGSAVILGASFPCPVLGVVGDYYGTNLEPDRRHTDRLSHEVLVHTKLGRFLGSLPYLNELRIRKRIGDRVGPPDEREMFRQYYEKYKDLLLAVLDNPDHPAVVTQEHLDDAAIGIRFLQRTVLSREEAEAAWKLYDLLKDDALGKNRRQIETMMHDEIWLIQFWTILIHVLRILLFFLLLCGLLFAVGRHYDLPLQDDAEVTDRVKREFFAQTRLGQLMASLPYVNAETIADRMWGEARDQAKQEARLYYDKYHDFLIGVLDDPMSEQKVTQEHLDDAMAVIQGLRDTGAITTDEYNLSKDLHEKALTPTLGMNRRQVVSYMDNPNPYNDVYNKIQAVDTIKLFGPPAFPSGDLDGPAKAAWWKLDADGNDASGSGHTLTIHDQNPWWVSDAKQGEYALRLDGGYAKTEGPVIDITESFTLAIWVRIRDLSSSVWDVISCENADNTGFEILGYHDESSDWPDVWEVFVGSPVGAPDDPPATAGIQWETTLQANAWTHLALGYDATAHTLRFYVNGQISPGEPLKTTATPAGAVYLGAWALDPQDPMRGDLDDVRIYQEALLPAQIARLAEGAAETITVGK